MSESKPITILCVEDQETLRNLLQQALTKKGYAVFAAATGADAIKRVGSHPGDLHVLVTDFNLPDMSGSELIRQVRALKPGVKVIVSTGDTETRVERKGGWIADVMFLPKPYKVSDLAAMLEAAVGS